MAVLGLGPGDVFLEHTVRSQQIGGTTMTVERLTEVIEFLRGHQHGAEDLLQWPNGMSLRMRAHRSDVLPPLVYVSSARGLIFRDNHILVMRNEDGYHIMPGGRREPDESLEQTLRREVGEEAGWDIGAIRLLGFSHFYHLTPVPENHPYPHPDFFMALYTAEAMTPLAHVRLANDYEIEAEFRPVAGARSLLRSAGEHFFLQHALQLPGE